MKVMLSSVRRGLADVRDATAPVIEILGYTCVRFENVTDQVVPPRAVCIQMVSDCDIYLLLLGELYGDPMPGTGLAPTEEEWTVARRLGKPTVVFKMADVVPEPPQQEFIDKVDSHEDGVWRGTFTDIADLIRKPPSAIAAAASALQPLTPRPMLVPVTVPWRSVGQLRQMGAGTVLETHLMSIGTSAPLPASSLDGLRRPLGRTGQDHGLFEDGQALDFSTTEAQVAAYARPDGRMSEAGVAVTRTRSVSVWQSVAHGMMGSVLDEGSLRLQVARDIRLAADLRLLDGEDVATAVGLDRIDMLGIALARPA